jgi:hypothetical protein
MSIFLNRKNRAFCNALIFESMQVVGRRKLMG